MGGSNTFATDGTSLIAPTFSNVLNFGTEIRQKKNVRIKLIDVAISSAFAPYLGPFKTSKALQNWTNEY